MKRILLFSFLLCLFKLSGQTNIDVTFDLNNKKLSVSDENIKTGKKYFLNFKNVNTGLMQIKVESNEYSLVSSIPESLKPILPGINSSSDFSEKAFINGITGQDGNNLDADNIPPIDRIYLKAKSLEKNLLLLKANGVILYKLSVAPATYSNTTTIKDKAQDIIDILFDEFKINVPKKADGTTNEEYENFTPIQKKNAIANLVSDIRNSINYIKSTNIFLKNKIENTRATRDVFEKQMIEYLSDLTKTEEDLIKNKYLSYLGLILRSLEMKSTYKYKNPISSKKDILETKIIILNTVTKDTIHKETLKFYTYEVGKPKFDFSTGFFYNNIIQKSYYLESRNDTTNNVLEEDSDDFDIAIGGLAHISWQLSHNLRGGLNLGIGVSPLDGNARYLFGLGALVGKDNLIGINAGVSVARISVLSNAVDKDDEGLFVQSSITAVPTFKKSEWGFYFGLTYNLTRKKKK